MKKRIDIRIDEEKLLIIRAYCERHKKNITAFFDKGADLVIEKYNVKGTAKKSSWACPEDELAK